MVAACGQNQVKVESQTLTVKLLLFPSDSRFMSGSVSHHALFSPAQNSTGKSANSFDNSNFQSLNHNTV